MRKEKLNLMKYQLSFFTISACVNYYYSNYYIINELVLAIISIKRIIKNTTTFVAVYGFLIVLN